MTAALRTRPVPTCPLCGDTGAVQFAGLRDRLFAVPGEWQLRRCGNRDCGLWWLDPAPITADLPRAYEQYFTHTAAGERRGALPRLIRTVRAGWIAAHHGGPAPGLVARLLGPLAWLHPGFCAELRQRAMYLPARPGGRLLEVGCGSGNLLQGMRELGWQVTGVDFDAKATAAARARGLDVRTGDLASQQFAGASFDAIAMFHLLEHVPDPRALLAECRRLLAPGGQLVVVTPNALARGLRRFGAHWLDLDPPRHLQIFAPTPLRREVERLGLHIERCTSSLRNAALSCRGSRAIARTGRFAMHDQPALRERLHGLTFLYASWCARMRDPFATEELVLVARAPS